jgi:hypothetical protein
LISPISVFKPVNTKKEATKESPPHLLLFDKYHSDLEISGIIEPIIKAPKGHEYHFCSIRRRIRRRKKENSQNRFSYTVFRTVQITYSFQEGLTIKSLTHKLQREITYNELIKSPFTIAITTAKRHQAVISSACA